MSESGKALASRLLAEALEGSRPTYEGSFTLALEKAREKMKNFQLPDARYYILQLVQAIVASGAERIHVTHETAATLTSYRIVLAFDGPGYTLEELQHLYDHLFTSQAERSKDRLRELALGVSSCQALEPRLIRVACGPHAWQRITTVDYLGRSTSVEQVGAHDASEGPLPHAIEVAGQGLDAARAASAVELLSSHCLLVPIPLRVNDVQINNEGGSWAGACPWPSYHFKKGDMSGMLGLPYETAPQSILHLLRYGVLFARRGEARVHPPVSVLCDNPSLRKNASQLDVTEDSAYLAFVEDLQQVLMDFALEFSRQKIPRYHLDTVHEFLVRHFEEWLSPAVVLSEEDESRELRAILDVPMFHDVRGQLRSLRDVVTQYRRDGFLSMSKTRMPYAPVQSWLVLNPSPYEEPLLLRLFGHVRWVDRDIFTVAGNQTQAGMRHDIAVETIAQAGRLVSRSVPGRITTTIAILDDFPDGQSQVLVRKATRLADGARLLPLDAAELDLLVEITSDTVTDAEALRLAHFAVQDHAERVFAPLLREFARRPDHDLASVREERELAHMVTWWMRRLREEGATTPESARRVLGTDLWTQRLFRTRAGSRVSLADLETWLAHFETLTVAAGGRRSQADHALDAGPALMGFLGHIFGPRRFQRATLKAALLQVREKQATLAGAADHPDALVVPDAPNEEEELLSLLRDAAASLETPVQETAGILTPSVNAAASDAPAEEPAPPTAGTRTAEAVETPAPADVDRPAATTPPPAGGAAPLDDASPPEAAYDDQPASLAAPPRADAPVSAPLPPPQALPRRVPEEVATADLPHLAEHAFTQGGLMGRLLIPVDTFSARVAACRDAQVIGHDRLFGLHVGGWVYADDLQADGRDVRWTPAQEQVLRGQLRLLYETLATRARTLDPRGDEFCIARARLIEHLRVDPADAWQRMERDLAADPLLSLPFLPTTGGTLATLRALAAVATATERILAVPRGSRDPDLGWPVVVLDDDLSAEWYRRVLNVPVEVPTPSDAPPADRLLAVVQRELRLLRDHGDFRLSDEMVDGLAWKSRMRGFIAHDPASGRTLLNPDHGVVRRVLQSFERDRQLVPVLVSSVYTAINRALEEVRDDHELAFLEALLLSSAP